MFTQTHLLISATLWARPGARIATIAGFAGALFPDSDVWVMFFVERLNGSTGCEVFHYRYWEEPWVTLQSVVNSIPLYLSVLLVAGVIAVLTSERPGAVPGPVSVGLTVFAASALLHVSADFFLHHEDARAQWLPFTDWVFRSPVSYWDPNHFGKVFAAFEIALAVFLVAIIGRRFQKNSFGLSWAY